MAFTTDIGSNLEIAAPETFCVGNIVATVTVKNVAGPALNHHTDLHAITTPAFTTTVGQSQAYTSGTLWLRPTGRTTITLTGGSYGA